MKKNLEDTIENAIDSRGLVQVLRVIRNICDLKADHLRTNWQDYAQADLWEFASSKIDKLAENLRETNKIVFTKE